MKELEDTFSFTKEDLEKNKSGFISQSQNNKLKKLEEIKSIVGAILSIIFLFISLVFMNWYLDYINLDPLSIEIPKTKHGETIPKDFFLVFSILSFLFSIFLIYVSIITQKKIKTIYNSDTVKTIDASLDLILYHRNQQNFPCLKVDQIELKNINSYKKDIFQPNLNYRFYYSELSKSLLSIELLSEELF
jgi:preprotein translocase subunit SecG